MTGGDMAGVSVSAGYAITVPSPSTSATDNFAVSHQRKVRGTYAYFIKLALYSARPMRDNISWLDIARLKWPCAMPTHWHIFLNRNKGALEKPAPNVQKVLLTHCRLRSSTVAVSAARR